MLHYCLSPPKPLFCFRLWPWGRPANPTQPAQLAPGRALPRGGAAGAAEEAETRSSAFAPCRAPCALRFLRCLPPPHPAPQPSFARTAALPQQPPSLTCVFPHLQQQQHLAISGTSGPTSPSPSMVASPPERHAAKQIPPSEAELQQGGSSPTRPSLSFRSLLPWGPVRFRQ